MSLDFLKNISVTPTSPVLQLFSNKRLLVVDCKGVIDYTRDCILLDAGKINVKITGDSLVMSAFGYGQTEITGEIFSVDFEKNE